MKLRRLFSIVARRSGEDVHDFLGVVTLDVHPALGVLVLPDAVATVLRVSGTDYGYGSESLRRDILDGWVALLNHARLSIQVFVDRRPYVWDLPGNYLDVLTRQVEASNPTDWQRRRLERWRDRLLAGELEQRFAVADLRYYLVIRRAIGSAEAIHLPGEDEPMYLPPTKKIWDLVEPVFGSRQRRLEEWRRRRNDAIRELASAVERIEADARTIPGFRIERCSGLEVARLLHVLWMGDDAYAEWIRDEAHLEQLIAEDRGSIEVAT
jgi:hypothetical protein